MTETENEQTYGIYATARNKKLIAELEARGENIIKINAPEIAVADLDEAALEMLVNPARFDWIVFTDVLTVDYFLEIAEANGVDLFELDDVRVCAFGEAVSDRLRFVQVHTDVLPNKIDDAEIIAAIENYVGGAENLAEQQILLVKPHGAKVSVEENLKNKKAAVATLEIYRIREDKSDETAKIKALIGGGAIDEFIFSAAEDVIYLKHLLNVEKPNGDLFEKFSATEPNIFKNLFENGIKPNYFQK